MRNFLRLSGLLLVIFLSLGKATAQLFVSGFMPNPAGTDSTFDYVQIFSTQDIDFSQTPYTVVVNNNGFAEPPGWVTGKLLTYAFLVSTGSVKAGETFFVGGAQKRINGIGSTDISSYNWLRVKHVQYEPGDGFGSPNPQGVVGNGGAHADGIAVFKGRPQDLDSLTIPLDAVFYGSVLGAVKPARGGYTVPTNEFYHQDSGVFGERSNTYLGPEAYVNHYIYLKGIYDTALKTWEVPRVFDSLNIRTNAPASDVRNRLGLSTMPPVISLDTRGLIDDFGRLYLNDSFSTVMQVSGSLLRDSLIISSKAPFEIRIAGITYTSGRIAIAPLGSYIDNLDVFIRFRPTIAGGFMDTVFFSSTGAQTKFITLSGIGVRNPRFSFTAPSVNISESGANVRVVARIFDTDNAAWQTDIRLASRTASEFTDFVFNSPTRIGYVPGGADSFVLNIPIAPNTFADRDRYFTLQFANATPHAVFGPFDSIRVNIIDDDFRAVSISELRRVDSLGITDSIGLLYEVRGTVHGINVKTSAGGFQFTHIDRTGGIAIFSPQDTFFYRVNEGDELTIKGRKGQFRGLTQIENISSLFLNSIGGLPESPRIVQQLDESTESRLVNMRFLRLASPGGIWALGNTNAITLNNDTIEIRVANQENNLIGEPRPVGFFDMTGIGGQFDNSIPYLGGYQLFPRRLLDITIIRDTIEPFKLIGPVPGTPVNIGGQPNQVVQFSWETPYKRPGTGTMLFKWMLSKEGDGFENPLLELPSDMAGGNANISISYTTLANMLTLNGVEVGKTLDAIWTVRAYIDGGTFEQWSSDTFRLNLTRETITGLGEISPEPDILIYPNPAKDVLWVKSDEKVTSLQLFNTQGELIDIQAITDAKVLQIPLINCSKGIYFVEIIRNDKPFRFKFAIE